MRYLWILFFICFHLVAETVSSPDSRLTVSFQLTKKGEPTYQVSWKKKIVIKKSTLGLELKKAPNFLKFFRIMKIEEKLVDNTWNPVWGEEKEIRNHYRELRVLLKETCLPHRKLLICFRVFDDGLGFRYEFPAQKNLDYFIVTKENTEFQLAGDHKTFWIPGDYDTNEYAYFTSKLSEIDASKGKWAREISTKTIIASHAVQTPLMMKSEDGLYINIHEAALVDYSAMHLLVNGKEFVLSAHLVPDAVGNKAYMQTPCKTPWRTILISDKAEKILSSRMILNLNEKSKIKDTTWIKPQKYIGIWWAMHVGKYS